MGVFLVSLVATSLVLHYGFAAAGALPGSIAASASRVEPSERFRIDYAFFFNLVFLLLSVGFAWVVRDDGESHRASERSWMDTLLLVLAVASLAWLVLGISIGLLTGSYDASAAAIPR